MASISNLPPLNPHFIGRQPFLEQLHSTISFKNGQFDNPLKTMTVLIGDPGCGKSCVALKYAHEQKTHWKNIFWIDATTKESTVESFLEIAQIWKICPLILQKRSWTCKLTPPDLNSLVHCVYHHFSRHYTSGLFIFDNAHQLKANGDGALFQFGIQPFLPPQGEAQEDLRIPNFLVTSSSPRYLWTDDEDKTASDVQVMELGSLDPEEGFKFLNKSLGVKPTGNGQVRQGLLAGFAATKLTLFIAQRHLLILPGVVISGFDLLKLKEFYESIGSLVTILQGFPLAMHLAMSMINVEWNSSGFTVMRYKVLNLLVKKYLKIIDNQLKLAATEIEAPNLNSGSDYDDWDILQNKLQNFDIVNGLCIESVNHILDSMNKMEGNSSVASAPKFKLALHLFNIISYLPPNSISVELCHALNSNICFDENYFIQKEKGQAKDKGQDDFEAVKEALIILESYGFLSVNSEECGSVSIILESDKNKIAMIKVHKLVQKWRRNYLKGSEAGKNCLKMLEEYFQLNCANLIIDTDYFLNVLTFYKVEGEE